MNVTGIFYHNANCQGANQDTILSKFQTKLYQKNSERQGFKDSVLHCCTLNEVDSFLWITSTCKNNFGEECSYAPNRCCKILKKAYFTPVNCINQLTGLRNFVGMSPVGYFGDEFMGPNCPTNCIPKCNGLQFKDIAITACNAPCNWNEWSDIQIVNIPTDCPSCVLQVGFKFRNTNNCVPVFTDYKIEFIIYDWNSCNVFPCNFGAANQSFFFNKVATYLLNNLLNPNTLINGQCINNVRLMKANCFTFTTDPLTNLTTVSPCDITYCCWVNLKICKVGGVINYTILNKSNWSNENCSSGESPSPCYYNCFEELFMPEN